MNLSGLLYLSMVIYFHSSSSLVGSSSAKTGASLALGFSFTDDAEANSDGIDEKSSNTEENKGIFFLKS